jgi:hypothetical protein
MKNFGGGNSVKLTIGRMRSRQDYNIQRGITKIDF